MSFLHKAGLALLTIGMLNAFGWVGSAAAAHCATIIKISPDTDALGTESDVPSPHHKQIVQQKNPQRPRPNTPKFLISHDIQPNNGSCSTESGSVRTTGSSSLVLFATTRADLLGPELTSRLPIPADVLGTNTSTSAIFEPPRL